MKVDPLFEQTIITHAQGQFVCNAQEFCKAVLEKTILKCFEKNKFAMFKVYGYYFTHNVGGATI